LKERETTKINQEKCIGCWLCIPYCPTQAIRKNVAEKPTSFVDQQECVECGTCLRSGVCPTDAIYWPELSWFREIKRSATGGGRGTGTGDVKSNDITGTYRDGEVAIGAELGRPDVGFYFRDLEKVTKALTKLDFEFEIGKSVKVLFDMETGNLKHREILNEKAMAARIEAKVKTEDAIEVINALREVARNIDTVLSIDIISKCKEGTIPVLPLLEEAGIKVRINGKTNIGLGRPLTQ